ncbi:unnamed protein product [Boreogadus saida]
METANGKSSRLSLQGAARLQTFRIEPGTFGLGVEHNHTRPSCPTQTLRTQPHRTVLPHTDVKNTLSCGPTLPAQRRGNGACGVDDTHPVPRRLLFSSPPLEVSHGLWMQSDSGRGYLL